MERRYRVLAKVRVKNLETFNSRPINTSILDDDGNPIPAKLPFIVIVLDELADIMMAAKVLIVAICKLCHKMLVF